MEQNRSLPLQAGVQVLKIAAIWEQFFDSVKNRPSAKVRQYYWNVLEPFFSQLDHTKVTEDLCREYFKSRPDISPSTVWAELSLLRTCLNWAVRKRIIAPYTYDVWLPTPSRPREKRLDRAEVMRLLDSCYHPHTRLFVLLLISTACRASAALDLTWDRVDFNTGLIDLRKVVDGQPEGKGRAVVPMTQSLRTALLEAKKQASTNYVIEFNGQRVYDAYNGFKRAATKAKIEWAHPHILRHTAATWMVEKGVPIPEVARYLGHSDSVITERVYAKYRPDYLLKASSALEL